MAARKKPAQKAATFRAGRTKLSAEQSLKRMGEFTKRKEHFVATVRKARIEVYLPDLPRPAYQDLLGALEEEFTYTFGGCTTMRVAWRETVFRVSGR